MTAVVVSPCAAATTVAAVFLVAATALAAIVGVAWLFVKIRVKLSA